MNAATPLSPTPAASTKGVKAGSLNGSAPHWAIDMQEAARHIARLTGAPDGLHTAVTFQTFDDRKHPVNGPDPSLAATIHGTLADRVARLNALHAKGAGVFITVNQTRGIKRKNTDVVAGRAVFIEDDTGANLNPGIAPQLTIESSPGKSHRYFLTHTTDLAQWRKVQKRLVQDFGSDGNAKDPARVLRLAGSWHLKDPTHPHRVRILDCNNAPPYTWADIEKAIPWVAPPDVPNQTPGEADSNAQARAEPLTDSRRKALIELVDRIDPAKCSYGEWLSVGMALHCLSGGRRDGLTIWDNWSERDSRRYKGLEEDHEKRWKGFDYTCDVSCNLGTLERLAGARIDMSDEYEAIRDDPESSSDGDPPRDPGDAPGSSQSDDAPNAEGKKFRLRVEPMRFATLKGVPPPPAVIVEQLFLMDACGFVAPGGTGKTTLAIFEAIHIILGRPLWGKKIEKPGRVMFLTAEDSRVVVETRVTLICQAMALTDAELQIVADGFYIEDLSMVAVRLVGTARDGRIRASKLLPDILEQYRDIGISLVHLDPASLIGPGEQSGNDGMAELMRAARRISAGLLAACQIVHHVAQAVARGGIQDQYAGRGATAFADNSRGNRQLVRIKERSYEFDGRRYRMPDTITDDHMAEGDVLAILVHKLSYVKLDPYPIFILRRGYNFTQFVAEQTGQAKGHTLNEDMELVAGFIDREAAQGRRHSPNSVSLESKSIGLARQRVTDLIREGLENGRFAKMELPRPERRGTRTEYLVTIGRETNDYSAV